MCKRERERERKERSLRVSSRRPGAQPAGGQPPDDGRRLRDVLKAGLRTPMKVDVAMKERIQGLMKRVMSNDEYEEQYFYARDHDEKERQEVTFSHCQDYPETYKSGIIFLCVDTDPTCEENYFHKAKEKVDREGVFRGRLTYGLVLDFDNPSSIEPLRSACKDVIDTLYETYRDQCRSAYNQSLEADNGNESLKAEGSYMRVGPTAICSPVQNDLMRKDPENRYRIEKHHTGKETWYFNLEKDELGRATLLSILYEQDKSVGVPQIAAHLKWVYLLGRTTRHLPSRVSAEIDDRASWTNPQMATSAKFKKGDEPFFEKPYDASNLKAMPEVAIRCLGDCWPHNLHQATALSAFVTHHKSLPYEGWIYTSGTTWNMNVYRPGRMLDFRTNLTGESMVMQEHAKDHDLVTDIVNWAIERSKAVGGRSVDWSGVEK